MAKKSSVVPKDVNQNAARIVALTTGEQIPRNVAGNAEQRLRSQAASILGKLGGSKGGKMRAKRLTADRRSEIAKAAANKRWGNRS